MAPFVLVTLVAGFSLLVPPCPRPEVSLVIGAATIVALGTAVFVLPWSRWPAWAQAIPPLTFFLALGFVRDANGGATSGLAPMAALPVVWFALYGTRAGMVAAVTGCTGLFLGPIVLIGGSRYPGEDWRRGLLWVAVSVMLGVSIRRLVHSVERHADSLDALLRLSRRMDTVGSAAARQDTCRKATEISGASLSALMEPDGAGNLAFTATNGTQVPPVRLPLVGHISGAVTAFNSNHRLFIADATSSDLVSQELVKATGVASMLFEPIRSDGKVIGVLCLGFAEERTDLDRDDIAIIEMIAHQFAAVTVRVDLLTRLETLAADASDLVTRSLVGDHESVFSYVSPSSFALLGRPAETLIGTSPLDLAHDEDRAMLKAVSAQVQQGRSTVTAAYRVAHGDGHWLWVETSVRPIIDLLTGRVTEIQSTTHDISSRKRMELELRRSNALFEGVLGAATDYSIVATDPGGAVTVFNEGAQRLLGYSAAEMIGRNCWEVLHDPLELAGRARELGVEPGFEVLVKLVRQGGADRREWTYLTKDGRRIHVVLTVTAMLDHDGQLNGFIGIAQDLIERDTAMGKIHAAYERERSMVAQLSDLAGARDQFVAAVTHDLRTPLTSIRGFSEILLESAGELPGSQRRMLSAIDRNAERLLRMVDDLLAVARIEAGKLHLVLAPVHLTALIEQLCADFGPETARRSLAFTVHADPALGVVSVDAHHIERVLSNLVSNAIKFTPDGGRVDVDAYRHDGAVTVTVTDTGIGIPDADQELMFNRFSRATTATERHISGTGLGLTIAQAIVHQHGGTISLVSKAGVGTTVTVHLPVGRSDPPEVQAAPEAR